MKVRIERLGSGQGQRLRAIRMRALDDAPDAFATMHTDMTGSPPELWEHQLNNLATFVAIRDDHDVGMVRGAFHDEEADAGYLISMWVAPEVRRQGVGALLVDTVVGWAKREGLGQLFLDVAEANAPAVGLYTRMGFTPTGATSTMPPPRTHIRELQMVLELLRSRHTA